MGGSIATKSAKRKEKTLISVSFHNGGVNMHQCRFKYKVQLNWFDEVMFVFTQQENLMCYIYGGKYPVLSCHITLFVVFPHFHMCVCVLCVTEVPCVAIFGAGAETVPAAERAE